MKKIYTLAFFASFLFSNQIFACQEKTLFDAIEEGDLNEVKHLVEGGADPFMVNEYDENLIHLAAKEGHTHIIKYLVEKHEVDCKKKADCDTTPAYYAARRGRLAVLKYLIEERGVDPNVANTFGIKLIHAAAQFGRVEIIKYLVSLGVDCNEKNENGDAPVHIAAGWERLGVLKYLIEECNVDCNEKNVRGRTPAHSCINEEGGLNILTYLVKERGADPSVVDEYGNNLIHIAAGDGNRDMIKYLISLDVDCNKKNKEGHTPAHIAAAWGQLGVLKYLIEECGIDRHVVDEDGRNLVHFAAQDLNYTRNSQDLNFTRICGTVVKYFNTDVIKYLINLGVDCNKKDKKGYIPAVVAIKNVDLVTLKYLTEKCDIDPNAFDNNSNNLIYIASKKGCTKIVKYLIEVAGADFLKKPGCDYTPDESYIKEERDINFRGFDNKVFTKLSKYITEIVGGDVLKKPGCQHYTPDESYIKNASKLDKLVKYLIRIKKRPKKNKKYIISLFEKEKTPAFAKIKALNELAKHKLLPKYANKLFAHVLFSKVFFDHPFACRYALQNNLEGDRCGTARKALKRKKCAYEKLYDKIAQKLLLEKPNVLLKWPELIPNILYNHGLYTKPNLKRLLLSKEATLLLFKAKLFKSNTKPQCVSGYLIGGNHTINEFSGFSSCPENIYEKWNLEKKKVEIEKLEEKPTLKKFLETKQLAKTIANNPDASYKDKKNSKQFGRSLNKATRCLWDLSKIVPTEVAAKILTYASIK